MPHNPEHHMHRPIATHPPHLEARLQRPKPVRELSNKMPLQTGPSKAKISRLLSVFFRPPAMPALAFRAQESPSENRPSSPQTGDVWTSLGR
jgi:hypothetical protein